MNLETIVFFQLIYKSELGTKINKSYWFIYDSD